MTQKDIKKLAIASYTKGSLDEVEIVKIVKFLNRKELKVYIRALRLIESKNTVIVTTADISTSNFLEKQISEVFEGKKVNIKEDKNLIAGIKIEDYDNIYEFNVKNTIENIVEYISQ